MRAASAIVALMASIGVVDQSGAQPPDPLRPPVRRPSYSPYLNLTRQGGTPVQNYYGLVRPEVEFRSGISQLRGENQILAGGLAAATAGEELSTGHSTGYMTHLRYFGTNRQGGAIGTIGGARPTTTIGGGVQRPAGRGR
jgi:hypothetical protein